MRKTMPVARRVFGEGHDVTLRMRLNYAASLWVPYGATLGDLREAVTILLEIYRTARRVFGDAHPLTKGIEGDLRFARGFLDRERETRLRNFASFLRPNGHNYL